MVFILIIKISYYIFIVVNYFSLNKKDVIRYRFFVYRKKFMKYFVLELILFLIYFTFFNKFFFYIRFVFFKFVKFYLNF